MNGSAQINSTLNSKCKTSCYLWKDKLKFYIYLVNRKEGVIKEENMKKNIIYNVVKFKYTKKISETKFLSKKLTLKK